MAIPRIRIDQVSKSFGPVQVIKDLSLDIERGEFVSLIGPSGSGKTTLLMLLAGFEQPSAGSILLDGQRIDQLPPHRRAMGVVFQNYALFPHMSVADNVAFPLKMRAMARAEAEAKVKRALDMVQLAAMRDRRPAQLSGGQQQRVALARALVFEPAVVLMDEPLGALDKQLREQMQLDIRALHKRLELTVVFVTHDQSEALTMSDRIAVFNHGLIEQIGSPRDIYDHPRTKFVAEFIGETNLLEGTVKEHGGDGTTIALASDRHLTVPRSEALSPGARVLVSVRPERILLGPPATAVSNRLPTRVLDSVYQGDHLRVQLDEAAFGLVVRLDRRFAEWPAGADVVAHFAPADCWVIAA
ncbi:ABC transporter ATP-binding protein [Bradyrhizobium sp.]|uniref:ABC transporter ATP-binding protein n=1 Tax=Bradyrhizobium sp. TaxID=376 RepID=UPI0025BA3739|nr:ABC transporter ATP-binding protein [Bradyrhizobium sp.]MBV8919602.1 ABC transporter ATP-binding protein [Bradyrhizobium sp.]